MQDSHNEQGLQNEQNEVPKIGFLKQVFSCMNTSFLIRNYFFGFIFLLIFFIPVFYGGSGENEMRMGLKVFIMVYSVLCFLFYPFATVVWEELKRLIMGDTIIFLPLVFMMWAKLIIKIFIFCFAIPVGTIGMIIVYFKTR